MNLFPRTETHLVQYITSRWIFTTHGQGTAPFTLPFFSSSFLFPPYLPCHLLFCCFTSFSSYFLPTKFIILFLVVVLYFLLVYLFLFFSSTLPPPPPPLLYILSRLYRTVPSSQNTITGSQHLSTHSFYTP